MRIRLLEYWTSPVHSTIEPGDYDESELPKGVARHLVNTQQAEWLDRPPGNVVQQADAPVKINISMMKRDELAIYAQQLGIYDEISGTGNNGYVTKNDLLKALGHDEELDVSELETGE